MTVALRSPPHRTHALTVDVLAPKRSDQFVVEERPSPEPWKAHANGVEIVKAALRGAQKLRRCGEHKWADIRTVLYLEPESRVQCVRE